MLSTVAVIGICVAVSVSFLLTGSVLAVWFLRIRDKRRAHLTSSVRRGLSTYHRAHLSIDGTNYSHIQQPRASLRRSVQRPYGIVTEAWAEVPSQESLSPQQMSSIEEQPEIDESVPAPKRRKSLRQNLYGNLHNVPKTRRQKRIDRAIAQNSLPLSPLSAITEFTDQSESTSPTAAELPTSITPRETPEKLHLGRPCGRPASIQWPLPPALCRPEEAPTTVLESIPARKSILIRKGSLDNTYQFERPGIGRSLSAVSAISDAPAGPLPPLPLKNVQRYSRQDVETTRRSNASLDTIGSSVLGSIINSPTHTIEYDPATPHIDLSSPGLHQFSPARPRGGNTAITVGMAAGKRAEPSTATGSATHSFRASIGEQTTLRNVSNSRSVDRSDQRFKNMHLFDSSLKTIDASSWRSDLPSRSVSHRSTLSPSLPAPVARRPYNITSLRHTMFESQTSIDKRSSNPIERPAGEILTGSPRQLAPPRPASVASGNPYQWDLRPPSLFAVSPLTLRKGHKRQNCVRISNLPPIDSKRSSKLPEMMEEEEEDTGRPESKPKIPGLTLLDIENGTPALRARASLVDIKASPSPFHNRPILEPTSRKRISYRRQQSEDPQGNPHPDSDVFTNSLSDPSTPSTFDDRLSGLRNWPISPTPRSSTKLTSTPPTLSAIEEPCDPDSPMLPSPALTSATLFPRKSGMPQGPRNPPVSARGLRNGSPSPLNGPAGQKPSADELRRSVMILRSGTSEGKLVDQSSQQYRNMGDRSVSNFSLPSGSQSNTGLAHRSASQMSSLANTRDKRRGSNMALNSIIGISRSKMSMAASPSTLSIWDDASVCDELDLELRNSFIHIPEQTTLGGHDPEAYENFLDQAKQYFDGTPRNRKDSERESHLTSPQGKGLGISNWGTPGSLYDRDGFLKEQ